MSQTELSRLIARLAVIRDALACQPSTLSLMSASSLELEIQRLKYIQNNSPEVRP